MVWPAHEGAELKVFRGEISPEELSDQPSILGRRIRSGDTLFFEPLVPFVLGSSYTAVFAGSATYHFQVPLPEDYERAEVLEIFPSADSLPANLLKFHLLFSRPMQLGNLYDHIALLTAAGDTIDRAILPLDPPLWNDDRTMLTLWLEPGRIKRNLGPNERLGPILREGRSYRLVVNSEMKDENGQALTDERRHTFFVVSRDTLCPDVSTWQITAPDSGTTDPLTIRFKEALDRGTLTTYLDIQDRQSIPVKGNWEVTDRERKAMFFPAGPWQQGTYRLRVDPTLEDLAGNNLQRLFDREIGEGMSREGAVVVEVKVE